MPLTYAHMLCTAAELYEYVYVVAQCSLLTSTAWAERRSRGTSGDQSRLGDAADRNSLRR